MSKQPIASIRIDPEVLHKARVAALLQKKPLGKWVAEAIEDKLKKHGLDKLVSLDKLTEEV